MVTQAQVQQCVQCGRQYPVAADQTDPATDEVVIDTRGLVRRNEWVCGACLDAAEDAR